jgi:uncharacterized tellurite resistance protein B-like protein
MVGRLLLRGGAYGGGRARGGNRGGGKGGGAAAALLAAGLAMLVLGSIGVLAGRILQAAVSRRREVLADASAVQFTRNPAGLANALKRIAASPLASAVRSVRREEIGHMLFATGRRSLAGLMATHPPVEQRIRALDPNWKPGEAPPPVPPARDATEPAARTAGQPSRPGPLAGIPGMPGSSGLDPLAAAALVGVVDLAKAERVLSMVPEPIHRAVLEPEGAATVCLALLLDSSAQARGSQLALLEARLGNIAADRIAQTAGHLADLSPTLRLALVNLAAPALQHLPQIRREDLVHLVQRLVELDGRISPQEAALAATLEARLSPEQRSAPDSQGALAILALMARAGHEDQQEAGLAWQRGVTVLADGGFPLPVTLPSLAELGPVAAAESAAHAARLAAMNEAHRQRLMEALAVVAAHDGVLREPELQMLRYAASVLDCPMPPLDDAQVEGSTR